MLAITDSMTSCLQHLLHLEIKSTSCEAQIRVVLPCFRSSEARCRGHLWNKRLPPTSKTWCWWCRTRFCRRRAPRMRKCIVPTVTLKLIPVPQRNFALPQRTNCLLYMTRALMALWLRSTQQISYSTHHWAVRRMRVVLVDHVAFFDRGICRLGAECKHCHYLHPGSLKRKGKKGRARQRARLERKTSYGGGRQRTMLARGSFCWPEDQLTRRFRTPATWTCSDWCDPETRSGTCTWFSARNQIKVFVVTQQ